jgi:hypothetical protein
MGCWRTTLDWRIGLGVKRGIGVSNWGKAQMDLEFLLAKSLSSSREKGGSGAARSIPFLLLPFRSKPLRLPLPRISFQAAGLRRRVRQA